MGQRRDWHQHRDSDSSTVWQCCLAQPPLFPKGSHAQHSPRWPLSPYAVCRISRTDCPVRLLPGQGRGAPRTVEKLGALDVALLHLLTLVGGSLDVADGGGEDGRAALHQLLAQVHTVAGGGAVQRGPGNTATVSLWALPPPGTPRPLPSGFYRQAVWTTGKLLGNSGDHTGSG